MIRRPLSSSTKSKIWMSLPLPFFISLWFPSLFFFECEWKQCHAEIGSRCTPCILFVIIGMKTTFVLKNSNNSLFPWPQVRFNAHKAWALRFPLRHAPFEQCHQQEEYIVYVFNDVWPLMAIHIDPLPHPCVPSSKGDQPLLRHAL